MEDGKCGMKMGFCTRHSLMAWHGLEYMNDRFVVSWMVGCERFLALKVDWTATEASFCRLWEILAMLAQIAERLDGCGPNRKYLCDCFNVKQRDAVLESCPSLIPERVIGEPV